MKKVKKDGWFMKDQAGYSEYYVIKGESLKIESNNDLNVNPEMSAHRMTQNFMKKNNSFKTNRVILSRFIALITENTTVQESNSSLYWGVLIGIIVVYLMMN